MRGRLKLPKKRLAALLLAFLFSVGGRGSRAEEVSQHAFFPEAYQYKVGDFILSLPVGYYEGTMQRLSFAQKILEEGKPKPVLDQERYLELPGDALAPGRKYFVLDQHHLLIFSAAMQLENAYPPQLEVLRREDAVWTDVSDEVLPKWARHPKQVQIDLKSESVKVSAGLHHATLRRKDSGFSSH